MTVQEYLNMDVNKICDLPETKLMMYKVLKEAVTLKKCIAIAVGGLRKAGKTTLLKQLTFSAF